MVSVSIVTCMLFADSYQDKANKDLAELAAPLSEISNILETYAIGNAVQHNTWDSAFIGKLIPSFPSHFGLGASANVTLIPMETLKSSDSSSFFGELLAGSNMKFLPFPASANGNIRIGGFFFPFDIGVHFMKLPLKLDSGINIDYLTYGADVRYAVMEEAYFKPTISLGLGATVTKGSVALTLNETDFTGSASTSFKATIVTAQAQISKKIFFLIPYAGARYSLASGTFGWNAEATLHDTTHDDYPGVLEANAGETKTYAFGKKSDAQVYGGLGLKFLIFDNTVGVSYDFMSKALGVNVDLRIKI